VGAQEEHMSFVVKAGLNSMRHQKVDGAKQRRMSAFVQKIFFIVALLAWFYV
jgi:hypothetical protein